MQSLLRQLEAALADASQALVNFAPKVPSDPPTLSNQAIKWVFDLRWSIHLLNRQLGKRSSLLRKLKAVEEKTSVHLLAALDDGAKVPDSCPFTVEQTTKAKQVRWPTSAVKWLVNAYGIDATYEQVEAAALAAGEIGGTQLSLDIQPKPDSEVSGTALHEKPAAPRAPRATSSVFKLSLPI